MITKSAGCYYGVHFGCLCVARDPNCHRCAERLTNAVNYTLHPSVATALRRAHGQRHTLAAVLRRTEKKRRTHILRGITMYCEIPSYRASNGIYSIDAEPYTKLLTEFGLSEMEAQLYVHLLKYGPKRAGDLARSLKTYREDAYRRCARLIDAGMIVRSAEDSSRYAPVDFSEALDAALIAHHDELDRLHTTKQELVERANGSLTRQKTRLTRARC